MLDTKHGDGRYAQATMKGPVAEPRQVQSCKRGGENYKSLVIISFWATNNAVLRPAATEYLFKFGARNSFHTLLAVNLVDYRFQASANRDLFFLLLARPFHFSAFQCFLWCSKATLSCRFPPLSSNSVIVTVLAEYWYLWELPIFPSKAGKNDPLRIHDGNG
ncbi:predicted protein [Histoplasma capsulatum G186AR]|uniref:Uncharacterized protein n=1 Tax=Ajellomyces capsulatus (strain G186AR / H82 / ATCC MYA-2454 / RMSCC 2432) TaxID=447093 RepID=C0NNG8_AJECG|nr:uncharacterized protein HCBG_04698 [Histoplasma capsulatum G186AR]EEH06478.1 predicted protein [Histoplasma capsulatum G186AR]